MKESKLADLFSSLDMFVLERVGEGSFQPVGPLPARFQGLMPGPVSEGEPFKPQEMFPFLEEFLEKSELFWKKNREGRIQSGIWSESIGLEEERHLEASAVSLGARKILLIEWLGGKFEEKQLLLQKGRELHLNYHRLAQAEARLREMSEAIEKNRDDLLAILNELSIGVVMTDEDGCVTFLNGMAQRLFGKEEQQVVGRPWAQFCRVPDRDEARVEASSEKREANRSRVAVNIESTRGRQYWVEVDVKEDPRDGKGNIFFLYDVTEIYDLRRMLSKQARFHDMIGKSKPMLVLYQQIQDLARVDSTVLISGETGSGKELVAKAIHASGHRKDNPFVAVNCAGLTESLIASQLFGHRRGAFTGAVADQQGVFEAAEGGSILLDEIGDIPINVQTSLLRVLQEREITRLGESKPRKVDVRVLAATQRDLAEAVAQGEFRSDLLYRIQVARITAPGLRERCEDIPVLVGSFLGEFRAMSGKSVEEVSDEAMRRLLDHDWPGNVRQLKSAIEFAVIRCKGSVIMAEDLPSEICETTLTALPPADAYGGDERERVLAALERTGGNRAKAARMLGMSRATLYRRLTSLNLDVSKKPGVRT